ncbi:PREDICTED: uncharacterized protein LOC109210902 isoform X1 [Nicotiana attenuata]|uniref:uncharacterized protein LOC109210902 isoform X1 n=1 Tax=Nicotiana attenuata TaxID=49451 RepID=UPI0009050E25|nr:PREDICTED: uncharacterized protein LOC109210902 isoform X1 [Nicotiana attenuata]XP_019229922.1 PREDICTED: uncharacterized protein LOC109210902 isoform X1 [Nicotiana attenuata]XP_019229923.1 PREDICTED: uncharacterized protein LOC109210902 isoform X1 [Nicotiana attenuata]
MSSGDGRIVSSEDIQMVQNRIEQCLRHYMSQREVLETLFIQDKIEPGFTELVWLKLEEENQEFFQAYHLKLMVKEQIMEFNKLLAEQVKMTHQLPSLAFQYFCNNNNNNNKPSVIPQVGSGEGSVRKPLLPCEVHQNLACRAVENVGYTSKAEHMHESIPTSLPNTFSNCSSAVLSCMQTADDVSAQSRKINVTPNILSAQTSNMGMRRTLEGKIIKTEPNYANNSHFNIGAHSSFLESRSALGGASISSVNSMQSNSQPLNRLPDADTTSFGFLGEIPQNFGLSDLSADFSNSSDILESYSRTPFLATDTGNLLDPNGDIERLTNVSDSLQYEGFAGD